MAFKFSRVHEKRHAPAPLHRRECANGGYAKAALRYKAVKSKSGAGSSCFSSSSGSCASPPFVQSAAKDCFPPPTPRNELSRSRQFSRSFSQFRFICVHTALGRVNQSIPVSNSPTNEALPTLIPGTRNPRSSAIFSLDLTATRSVSVNALRNGNSLTQSQARRSRARLNRSGGIGPRAKWRRR